MTSTLSSGTALSGTTAVATLVLLDDPTSALHESDLELLTLARTLGPVTTVSFAQPTGAVLATLGAYGVGRVLVLDSDAPHHLTSVAALGLAAALEASGSTAVLARASFANKEIAALLALRTGAGLIIDATRVEAREDGSVFAAKRVFAGSWDIECATRTSLAVLTVRSGAIAAEPVGSGGSVGSAGGASAAGGTSPEVVVLPILAQDEAGPVQLLSRTEHVDPAQAAGSHAPARPSLSEATIVVAGGRGTLGDFGPVEELADVLGAGLGATRDCVDEGWIDHDAQIGQTGVTIAPRLYIGAGISGAPHHRGGMQASEIIVAVNADPQCPLFEISDFAVVGDLAQILPQATEAIEAYKATKANQPR